MEVWSLSTCETTVPAQLVCERAERVFIYRAENIFFPIACDEFEGGSLPTAAFSGDDQATEGSVHIEIGDLDGHCPGIAVMFSKPFLLEMLAGIFAAGSDGSRLAARRVHFVGRFDHRIAGLKERVLNACSRIFAGR